MQADPSSTLENLSRLASKPGVHSTLLLSKTDGAIIRSSGLRTDRQQPPTVASDETRTETLQPLHPSPMNHDGQGVDEKSAEDIARLVFALLSSASDLTDGLEQGNEIQLLRLRTRKNEVVIYPDSNYLLVVIHDPPKSI